MSANNHFLKKDLDLGFDLLKNGHVGQRVFSHGTYQVEVNDGEDVFWPFLQLDRSNEIQDYFCTCSLAENNKSCPHLGAAYYAIFNQNSKPLHVRFEESLWACLTKICAKRHGFETSCLIKKDDKSYSAQSFKGNQLFSIKAQSKTSQKALEEIVEEREVETEETSLKFSNLSETELELYRDKRPSFALQYELSFWSDIAKYLMVLQENTKSYEVLFKKYKAGLPTEIVIKFKDIEVSFYIAKVNWGYIIPALLNVETSMKVYEFRHLEFEKIIYHPEKKSFELFTQDNQIKFDEIKGVVELSKRWLFHKDIGFFARHLHPIFDSKIIEKEDALILLTTYHKLLDKYLQSVKIQDETFQLKHQLKFDEGENLHISGYLFEKDDLQSDLSEIFGNWIYLHGKGFFRLNFLNPLDLSKVIPKEKVSSFVTQNRLWLNTFEGFQSHLTSIEVYYSYEVDELDRLNFCSSSNAFEGAEGVIDFGEWVYIENRGFYAKSSSMMKKKLIESKSIPRDRVSDFIEANEEDLEYIRGFFSNHVHVQDCGMSVRLNSDDHIEIEPTFCFSKGYDSSRVRFFGRYSYVSNEGFAKLPHHKKIPAKYAKKKILKKDEEYHFLTEELAEIKPILLHMDQELKRPRHLFLKLNNLSIENQNNQKKWFFSMSYKSEFGQVSVKTIYDAIKEKKSPILKTKAGLFFLDDQRLSWIRDLSQSRFQDNGALDLSVFEWIKVSAYENIEPPSDKTEDGKKSLLILKSLQNFETENTLNLKGFVSKLRPYQEIGVKWLWFLYSHSLSGILCDEMGLGKTHQAMALLASSINQKGKTCQKYLIVCPTSVIYHWEQLLEKFLPKAKVLVFYGVQRSLKGFCEKSDILLTSYGTLRSEIKCLKGIDFKLAIFDELQIAKNAASQTHKALKSIKAYMKLGLSGTPIENRLLELHSLFDVILPNYLPSEAVYKEQFVAPIEKNQDRECVQVLKGLIDPFILRRKKEDVLNDLPEKTEEISYVVMTKQQSTFYKEAFKKHKKDIFSSISDNSKPVPYMHIFSLFNKLKQICDHPALFKKDPENFEKYTSGKWELFTELLAEARDSGRKVVVFSQYLTMLDIIENHLKKLQIGYAQIRGSTRDRKEQIIKFREDPTCEVFLGSLQASGVGIDLVSASVVIHYDRWWNPAKENQATDRVHRIGQIRGVQVFKLVTKNTIEEHIHRLINKKLGLLKNIIGYDDQDQIKQLGRDDLVLLLKQLNKDLTL